MGVALREFASKGYSNVTLEQIAQEIGITRSAVLHHFHSKPDLLREIVEPFETVLGERLAAFDDADIPLGPTGRTALLSSVVDVYYQNRQVLILLTRDISSHWPIHISPRMAVRLERIVRLLVGDAPTAAQRVVVDCLLGVISRPLLDPWVDTDEAPLRELVLELATGVAGRLDCGRSATPEAGSDRARSNGAGAD
jgi:AcrR family transcriptional regulator